MEELKIDDVVECIDAVGKHFTVGKKYTVVGFNDSERPIVVDNSGTKTPFIYSKFKLADSNEMPKLEAGMIVELKDGTYLLFVNENLMYTHGGEKYGTVRKHLLEDYIVAVFNESKHSMDLGLHGNLIWRHQPKKTATQLKIEDLRATIDGAVEKLSELEAIEASRN